MSDWMEGGRKGQRNRMVVKKRNIKQISHFPFRILGSPGEKYRNRNKVVDG